MSKSLSIIAALLLAIAHLVLFEQPASGYQIQLEDFIPGLELRPGYHAVAGVALSPNEERLYAAHWQAGAVQTPDPIAVYSTFDNSLVDQLVVGGCVGGVIVSSDGRYVFGPRYYGGLVYRFDTWNENAQQTIDLGSWAMEIWKTPDNNRAIVVYNASSGSPSVSHHLALIDISGDNFSVVDTVNVGRPVSHGARGKTAFLPDSSQMYVDAGSSTTEGVVLLEISLNDSITVNRKSDVLAGGPNQRNEMAGVVLVGDILYVGDHDNKKIHIVDRLTLEKTGEISLPYAPWNIALHPDNQHLFIAYGTDGIVSVLDLVTMTEVGSLAGLAKGLTEIIFTSDVTKAYIAHYDQPDGGVSVLSISGDSDGDGIPDGADNCPGIANPGQEDNDSDGMGDVCDPDDDNDSVLDASDNCPLTSNSDQSDLDSDGQGDVCDPDDDNDNVLDGNDNCPAVANPGQSDLDGDGLGDVCDNDPDGDGIEAGDNCPYCPNPLQEDNDSDGQGDACDPDDDNDEVDDGDDNCPTVANTDQDDLDADNIGDACDADIDGDGIDNDADNCPLVHNVSQDDTDSDGAGDACDDDDDNDGVADTDDNCPLIANPNQSDLDGDGQGDVCDGDIDGDGVANEVDNCPHVANANQNNWDGDEFGDACDEDIDGDNVLNENDICEFTPLGEIVDPDTGCSIDQLCPCEGLRGTTVSWKNHGKYVSCIAKSCESFVDKGLITEEEKDQIVSGAANSDCGMKK